MKTLSYHPTLSRRIFLTQAASLLVIPSFSGCGNTPSNVQASIGDNNMTPTAENKPVNDHEGNNENKANNKTLVLYFSHSGNTRVTANQIHTLVGGDLIELKTVHSYPQDYNQCVDQARKELDTNFRPQLQTKIENLGEYGTVYLGYPNWWGTTPMAVVTMLETYDFSGKTIIPFCTHEGSAIGQSAQDIAKGAPKSNLLNGLAIRGRSVQKAQPDVEKWLRQLGRIKSYSD